MTVNRNLRRTVLVIAVVLGTFLSSPAAFAATGSHSALATKALVAKIRGCYGGA
jgi:hypothetical protein